MLNKFILFTRLEPFFFYKFLKKASSFRLNFHQTQSGGKTYVTSVYIKYFHVKVYIETDSYKDKSKNFIEDYISSYHNAYYSRKHPIR